MMRSRQIMIATLISLLTLSILSIFVVQTPRINAKVIPTFGFEDVEASFIVYPDGHVVVAVASNSTNVTFPYTVPEAHGFVGFTLKGDLTSASANFRFILPPKYAAQFPFNSTTLSSVEECSEGIDSISVNCSVVLPVDTVSKFPFNSTDIEITGEYADALATGTITVHILPGFALSDLTMDFQGNRTHLTLNGSTTVVYGRFYNFDLDEDSLDAMLLFGKAIIPGRGASSLYDRTNGLLECTRLETRKTSTDGGATVDFEVEIRGEDFIQALASLMYKGVPGLAKGLPIPGEMPNTEMLFSILNATLCSIQNASFQLAYTHAQGKVELRLAMVEDLEKVREGMTSKLPEIVPPEMKQLMGLLLNKTYCSVKSYKESITYANGVAEVEAIYTIEGDLNAEINYLKRILLPYAGAVPLEGYLDRALPWQVAFVNETEIDVSDLRCGFDVTETSVAFSVEEAAVFPPIDAIDATSFRLERFFSLAEDSKFPGQGETLKVSIAGGGNATHSVTLIRPETVPEPDVTISGNRVMIWHNQTLSALKDMIFSIQPEGAKVSTVIKPEYVTTTRPFTVNASENAAAILDITQVSKSVTIVIRNVTAPADVVSPPGTFKVLGSYVEIIPSETDITVSATIRIYYTPEQLSAAGLDETSLKIHYWNATLNEWIPIDSQVHTTEHYVSATIDNFSIWALMGQPSASIWAQLWIWAFIGAIMVIIVVVLAYAATRRKPST